MRRRKTGYWLGCVLAALILLVSGFSHSLVQDVSSIGSSHAIASGPSVGPQNILLMGLESRRDWNGNILPASILSKLHAGNAQAVANGAGGNDTNTLILIHIPAGGKKAVGFSIPRDDWVHFAGTVVRGTFYPRPGPPQPDHRGLTGSRATTVDVLSGGNTTGLAARVAAGLAGVGFRAGRVGNTSALSSTEVRYGPGASVPAGPIAALFGATAVASGSVPPHQVEILLGASATLPDIPASATPGTPDPVIPTAGPQGGAVVAKNGIPCVN